HRAQPVPHTFISVCIQSYVDHPALYSFPTRRSSDLAIDAAGYPKSADNALMNKPMVLLMLVLLVLYVTMVYGPIAAWLVELFPRSEEHTSELQSREHLVCRLLLEKKKLHKAKIYYPW